MNDKVSSFRNPSRGNYALFSWTIMNLLEVV